MIFEIVRASRITVTNNSLDAVHLCVISNRASREITYSGGRRDPNK